MAVWVLAPDVPVDRQQRALRVVDEFYKRALQYGDDLEPYVDRTHSEAGSWLDSREHMRHRRTEARSRWADAAGLTKKQALNVTTVVGAAAEVVFSPSAALDVRLLWRLMSGDAHALTWQLVGRSTLTQHVGGGMAEFAAGGDLVELADVFGKCYRLTKQGWSLFDRRCETPKQPCPAASASR